MSETNLQRLRIAETIPGKDGGCQFIWKPMSNLRRQGEEFTAVVDFADGGEVLNVELIFFHSILLQVDSLLRVVNACHSPDGALTHAFGNPIAEIKLGSKGARITGHMTGDSAILVDGEDNACGVEIYDLRDEGRSGLPLNALTYQPRAV